jgi:hypothetical protein
MILVVEGDGDGAEGEAGGAEGDEDGVGGDGGREEDAVDGGTGAIDVEDEDTATDGLVVLVVAAGEDDGPPVAEQPPRMPAPASVSSAMGNTAGPWHCFIRVDMLIISTPAASRTCPTIPARLKAVGSRFRMVLVPQPVTTSD